MGAIQKADFPQLDPLLNHVCANDLKQQFDIKLSHDDTFSDLQELVWSYLSEVEPNIPPFVLVERDGLPVGMVWTDLGYDCEQEEIISTIMTPLTFEYLVSGDTSLNDLLFTIADAPHEFLVVLQGRRLTGWITFKNLFDRHLKFYLLSLALKLEDVVLQLLKLDPELSLNSLKQQRIDKARHIWHLRMQNHPDATPSPLEVLAATEFCDKCDILTCRKLVPDHPRRKIEEIFDKAEKVRNELVHTSHGESRITQWSAVNLVKFILDMTALIAAVLNAHNEALRKKLREHGEE